MSLIPDCCERGRTDFLEPKVTKRGIKYLASYSGQTFHLTSLVTVTVLLAMDEAIARCGKKYNE
jgi:hypothetical protein